MFVVTAWTFACLVIAALAVLIVLKVAEASQAENRAMIEHDADPFAARTARAWSGLDTRTGRVRLILAAMASREADAAGASREPVGLHRATL